ncbi:hypothetical protein MalM25_12380 [Planctomycetes bacterium MalM25]|nr:hypothetical protein MalM25_12380 [Planctomycetes bacterium MalM25]
MHRMTSEPTPPKRRPRISLLSLLLLMAVVGTTLMTWMQWRELGPLRTENRRLKEERGDLFVADPKRVHAIRIPKDFVTNQNYAFRVWVPRDGRKYFAVMCLEALPRAGVPATEQWSDGLALGTSGGKAYASSTPVRT